MGKYENLTGRRYGMLTVISRADNRGTSVMWNCLCDCGNNSIVIGNNLRRGKTRSCGCQLIKHGKRGSRLYSIWQGMKARCYRPNHKWYKRYGGRGITVCEEWKNNFLAFYDWALACGYSDELTIDRVDNDKGYSPDNCRWASEVIQKNNRQNNVSVDINGKTQTLAQWAAETEISYGTLYRRYTRGIRGVELIKEVDKTMSRRCPL